MDRFIDPKILPLSTRHGKTTMQPPKQPVSPEARQQVLQLRGGHSLREVAAQTPSKGIQR